LSGAGSVRCCPALPALAAISRAANVDAYNVLNANSVRSVLSTYGARWRTPTQILDPRLVELGGTISF